VGRGLGGLLNHSVRNIHSWNAVGQVNRQPKSANHQDGHQVKSRITEPLDAGNSLLWFLSQDKGERLLRIIALNVGRTSHGDLTKSSLLSSLGKSRIKHSRARIARPLFLTWHSALLLSALAA